MTRALNRLADAVQRLHPVYFALVMATGILAIAVHLEGMRFLAVALTYLNSAAFAILSLMTIARAVFYPAYFLRDLADHNRGMEFLTIVAGACILGAQFIVILGQNRPAAALWSLSLILWIGFTYAIFTAFTVKRHKPSLADGLNSGWLIAVVSTQAVAQLSLMLLPWFGAHRREVIFLALSLWLAGGMLYIWIISLIFYRYTFFHLAPWDLRPPYWIDMGAMAISALVGTTLVSNTGEPLLLDLVPFLKGFTMLFWATATWWIPMLLILAVWRHVVKRLGFAYNPLYWGAVFPLGVYAVATFQLAGVTRLRFMLWISMSFTYIALTAWLAAFAGLIRTLVRSPR
jgi:tellurite resistance protein TehA-like permease